MLRLAALVILLSGLVTATAIWLSQDRIDRQARAQRNQDSRVMEALSPEDSRRSTHDVEMYYGKSGLLLDKATRWLEELSHGKPLAWTIAVASLVIAGGCLFLARIYHSAPRQDRP